MSSLATALLAAHHARRPQLGRLARLLSHRTARHSSPCQPPADRAPPSAPEQAPPWKPIPSTLSLSRRTALYQALAKSRLSSLITLTTMASYALSPASAASPPGSLTTLLATAAGTFLCSASANTLNQIFEAPMDAQMARTRARPLARRAISSPHAATFASVSALSGSLILATIVNPTTALLGLANLLLYAFLYTPLKRISIANTWLGALVGGLPALMGSTAAGASLSNPASWLTAALLYVWQFPHFNSLAHTLRRDYARAGYMMMANLSPALNARVSLRYALATVPLSSWLIPYYGLTTPTFGLLSLLPNLALIIPAIRFWLATPTGPLSQKLLSSINVKSIPKILASFESKARQEHEAKTLFWASLIHLPTLLILMMACRPSPSSPDDPIDPHITPE
ncbi:hypothetical protein PTTG_07537 [Puccinia triticina 1-1 BBBD Race 1]|uniref:Protoheme IX farnesyltransferase, mitochondrial n=2 Tax=Puccinia triticina TaxID=208348 RepID=A0A0C4F363_PUCT1|nr:uncharacterized protein PtA15_10A432 [Puccinia triticina]OAV98076.1 hypothetical protein PTTG_07537 [Puccinia triticina 1-1 BBBD Race 1]WAQ89009.1 hypothetical protein PtA15_10A432 [Puccinia triticina]WAR59067.1 hypothetical protein PtB15_10B409 [Puccinia triticina]